jgi:hypothetical protein
VIDPNAAQQSAILSTFNIGLTKVYRPQLSY